MNHKQYPDLASACAAVLEAKKAILKKACVDFDLTELPDPDSPKTGETLLKIQARTTGFILGLEWLAREIFPAIDRDASDPEAETSEALYLIEAVLTQTKASIEFSAEDLEQWKH